MNTINDPTWKKDTLITEAMKYYKPLLYYAYACLHDLPLAEDAIQESLLIAADKWQDFKQGTNLFGWVKKILYYKILQMIEKRKPEFAMEETTLIHIIDQKYDQLVGTDYFQTQTRHLSALKKCFGKLKKNAQYLLYEYYWSKRSNQELAKILKTNINSIRLRLTRLRKKLGDCIQIELK